MQTSKNITIVGAGLVGSLLSIYLAKRGHTVKIYERRPDMRTGKVAAGRSINLALSDRGILALKEVGILEDVMKIAIAMPGRAIHTQDGQIVFQPYGKEGQAINSVSRGALNIKLIDLAEREGVKVFFNQKLETVNWKDQTIRFSNQSVLYPKEGRDFKSDNTQETTVSYDLLFGSDGAFSAARLNHMLQHDTFNYQQFYINCGYKELNIPAGTNGQFLIDKNALHIWPRKEFMLIALPNTDGSFTCTLFFPQEGESSLNSLDTEDKVTRFFTTHFSDVVSLIPDLAKQFLHNPSSSLVTVKCFPWIRDHTFSLIGDAAHAIVPFFGQGMNCGFEDCSVLNNLMDVHGDDWNSILETFQELRKPDADAIADLAINNFREMSERTADPKFILQKKIEASLHELYPDLWIPAYTQVTFSPQIRYSEALQRGEKQELIMQEIMKLPDIEQTWMTQDMHRMILKQLQD